MSHAVNLDNNPSHEDLLQIISTQQEYVNNLSADKEKLAGALEESTKANIILQQTVNLQKETVLNYQRIAMSDQNSLAKANQKISETVGRRIRVQTADGRLDGKAVLMASYVPDVHALLNEMQLQHQLTEIDSFREELERVLVSTLPDPFPEKIPEENESFNQIAFQNDGRKNQPRTVDQILDHLTFLRSLEPKCSLAYRLQILFYDYIFPTKLCIGELKNLALRKASVEQVRQEIGKVFFAIFESISIKKEEHLFEDENKKLMPWQVVLSRGLLQRIEGGTKAFVCTVLDSPKPTVDPCDAQDVKRMFDSDEQALDKLEKGKIESIKAAKIYQDLTLYISCDGDVLDNVDINNSRIITACEQGGDLLRWLIDRIWQYMIEGSEPPCPLEGTAGGDKDVCSV